MTLVGPAGQRADQRDWAVLFAVAMVVEAGLLWLLACLLVLRRRLALARLSRTGQVSFPSA